LKRKRGQIFGWKRKGKEKGQKEKEVKSLVESFGLYPQPFLPNGLLLNVGFPGPSRFKSESATLLLSQPKIWPLIDPLFLILFLLLTPYFILGLRGIEWVKVTGWSSIRGSGQGVWEILLLKKVGRIDTYENTDELGTQSIYLEFLPPSAVRGVFVDPKVWFLLPHRRRKKWSAALSATYHGGFATTRPPGFGISTPRSMVSTDVRMDCEMRSPSAWKFSPAGWQRSKMLKIYPHDYAKSLYFIN